MTVNSTKYGLFPSGVKLTSLPDGTVAVAVDIQGGAKCYVALLSQAAGAAPVATVLLNSLGGTVVWARSAQGVYVGTLAGIFTLDHTVILGAGIVWSTMEASAYSHLTVNTVGINTYDVSVPAAPAAADDVLAGSPIIIYVFP